MKLSEAKILQNGDTGFGFLVEQDAGYLDKTLNVDLYNKLIKENFEIKPNEPILVNCILQKWGVKNKNGRIYPKEVLIPEVERYMQLVDANSAMSEADHAENSIVSLQNGSHVIKKMWWGNGENHNVLYGVLELITTPGYHKYGVCSMIGDKIVEYLKRGIRIGISSRGVGSLKEVRGENIVQNDFELICFDLVHSPSTPGAYLFPNQGEGGIVNSNNSPVKPRTPNSFNEQTTKKGIVINEKYSKIITKLEKFII